MGSSAANRRRRCERIGNHQVVRKERGLGWCSRCLTWIRMPETKEGQAS